MTNYIVNVAVSQQIAPAPSTLQQTGAFISQGGTTNAVNSFTILTQSSSLASMLVTPLTNSTLSWGAGLVTVTTSSAHGLTVSQVYYLTIAGAIPAGYNGTYPCTITSTNQFTYPLATNPGTETAPGTWASSTYSQLQQMNNTFWAQGSNTPVYVIELGLGSVNSGVATLTTWLSNNTNKVYGLLVPREWDANANFLALIALYESPNALLEFWVSSTPSTYTSYTSDLMNDVIVNIEAPTIAANEFSLAAPFWQALSTNPSSTNRVAPFSFRYLYGVTPYPTTGNSALFLAWKTAGINWIGTGAQGGISQAIWFWGTTADGNPLNYWYAVDWLQINVQLNITAAVINGSNNSQNPLYLNQDGINSVQAVGAATLSSAVTFGMLVGQVVQSELNGPAYAAALAAGQFAGQAVINAVPFVAYYTASPSDFATGTYNGLSCTVTPLRGFTSITFYIVVTNFVAI